MPRATAPVRKGDDSALAASALVELADLPGWSEHPEPAPDIRCSSRPFRGARARATSRRLQRVDTSIQEAVAIFRTEAASRRAFARLNSRTSLACLQRNERNRISEQTEGPASMPALMRVESLGPTGRAIRYISSAPTQIGSVRGLIDAVHLRVGRGIGALIIVSGPKLVTDETYEAIVAIFKRRLDGALSSAAR